MPARTLTFLGAGDDGGGELFHDGAPLAAGASLALVRTRSPWSSTPEAGVERVIVGTHPARADVLLAGRGLHAEHVRFYFPDSGAAEARPLVARSFLVNGRPCEALEWVPLAGGEELRLGPWRFRYAVE